MSTIACTPPDAPSWDNFNVEYEKRVEPFTSQFAEEMLLPLVDNTLQQPSGNRKRKLLDIGCGTGAVSLLALSHGFNVTATDFSPSMVERTMQRILEQGGSDDVFSSIAADGQSLPAEWSNSFDVAVANFSVIFFLDPEAGLKEMLRCLQPSSGIAAFTAWGSPSETPAFQVFPDVVAQVAPELVLTGKPPRIDGSIDTLAELMKGAGYVDIKVVGPIVKILELASPAEYYNRFSLTSPHTAARIAKMDDAMRNRFQSRVMATAKARGGREDGSIALNASAYIAYGRKPSNIDTP